MPVCKLLLCTGTGTSDLTVRITAFPLAPTSIINDHTKDPVQALNCPRDRWGKIVSRSKPRPLQGLPIRRLRARENHPKQ